MKKYILAFENEKFAERFFVMFDGKNNPDVKQSKDKKYIVAKLAFNPKLVSGYMNSHKITSCI